VIRLGVVGAGTVAQRRILPHAQSDVRERVCVTAVCDPAEGRARRVAERFGIPHAFTRSSRRRTAPPRPARRRGCTRCSN